jgi:hypothetical protein
MSVTVEVGGSAACHRTSGPCTALPRRRSTTS